MIIRRWWRRIGWFFNSSSNNKPNGMKNVLGCKQSSTAVSIPNGTTPPSRLNRRSSRWSSLCGTAAERSSYIRSLSPYGRTSILTNTFSRKGALIGSNMRFPSSTPGITTQIQVNDKRRIPTHRSGLAIYKTRLIRACKISNYSLWN